MGGLATDRGFERKEDGREEEETRGDRDFSDVGSAFEGPPWTEETGEEEEEAERGGQGDDPFATRAGEKRRWRRNGGDDAEGEARGSDDFFFVCPLGRSSSTPIR